jgi:RNA polymerase sigma-70 factor (ECF subfamily)
MSVGTEQLWLEMRERLAGFFRRRVRDEHAVGDLVAETFLRVHAGLAGVREDERVEAWVWRVARNVLGDHRRREHAAGHEDGAVDEAGDPPEAPGAAGADAANFNADVDSWLREFLEGELSPEQREAVLLADLQGVPHGEIAQRLGLSLTAAKSRVQRGRERLRELVAACCHLEFDRHQNVVAYRRRAAGPCCSTPPDRGAC